MGGGGPAGAALEPWLVRRSDGLSPGTPSSSGTPPEGEEGDWRTFSDLVILSHTLGREEHHNLGISIDL